MAVKQQNTPILPVGEQPIVTEKKKKKKKKKKKNRELSRNVQNVIKTTMRNNVDLTAIADYKANILLTLSSLIFTILIPVVLANLEIILDEHLYVPIFLLFATCVTTMILAALATRPTKLSGQSFDISGQTQFSPFFFGNYYKLPEAKYKAYLRNQMKDPEMMKEHMITDLFYLGKALGGKYSRIRICYTIFIAGIAFTVTSAFVVILFF